MKTVLSAEIFEIQRYLGEMKLEVIFREEQNCRVWALWVVFEIE